MLILQNKKYLKILFVLISVLSNLCVAQDFPTKPLTMIVPFSAGGPTDSVARLLAVPMGKYLGQTVLVENSVGAGGTIAANKVAKSPKDGYTLLIHHIGISTAPALYAKLNYDTLNDFEYIGEIVNVPMTLIGSKNFPPNNMQEL